MNWTRAFGHSHELRRNRQFWRLQVGQAVSSAGSQSSALAYPLVALSYGGPAQAGLVAASRLLPTLAMGLPAGIAADRFARTRIMLVADGVRAAVVGLVAVLIATGSASIPSLCACAIVEGAGAAFYQVAAAGLLKSLVASSMLNEAVAVQEARTGAVRLLAPVGGGVLYAISSALPFATDAGTYIASFWAVSGIRPDEAKARPPASAAGGAGMLDGFRYMRGRADLLATTLFYTASNFTVPALLLATVLAARQEGWSSISIGAVTALFGAATLAGARVAVRTHERLGRLDRIMSIEWLATMAAGVYVAVPSPWVLAVALMPLGWSLPVTDSAVTAYRLATTPDDLVGRVESARLTAALVASPLGPLLIGAMFEWSRRMSVLTALVVTAASAVWALRSGRLQVRYRPEC